MININQKTIAKCRDTLLEGLEELFGSPIDTEATLKKLLQKINTEEKPSSIKSDVEQKIIKVQGLQYWMETEYKEALKSIRLRSNELFENAGDMKFRNPDLASMQILHQSQLLFKDNQLYVDPVNQKNFNKLMTIMDDVFYSANIYMKNDYKWYQGLLANYSTVIDKYDPNLYEKVKEDIKCGTKSSNGLIKCINEMIIKSGNGLNGIFKPTISSIGAFGLIAGLTFLVGMTGKSIYTQIQASNQLNTVKVAADFVRYGVAECGGVNKCAFEGVKIGINLWNKQNENVSTKELNAKKFDQLIRD
jgi:hypothetical protein